MTVAQAKKEYNQQLKRYYKAEGFFNSNRPQEEKEKFLPDFKKLLMGLSQLLRKIGIYTPKEVMEGFDE